MELIFSFVKVYIIIQLVSLSTFIIFIKYFSKLYDLGYFLSKILGISILAYTILVLSSFKLVPFTNFSLLLILLSLFATSIFIFYRKSNYFFNQIKSIKYKILTGELLLLIISLTFGVIRSTGTGFANSFIYYEDSMDFSILNYLFRTNTVPPQDPWFAGTNLNYYYFGHLIFAIIARMANVTIDIIYPLALGFSIGIISILIYSIFLNSINKILPGIISIVFFLSAPLNLIRIFLDSTQKNQFLIFNSHYLYNLPYFTEYPLYTYSVASLHASSVSLIFDAALLLMYLQFKKMGKFFSAVIIAFFMALSFMTSSWDIFIMFPLFLLFYIFNYNLESIKRLFKLPDFFQLILIFILFFLFVSPYLFFYKGQSIEVYKTAGNVPFVQPIFYQFGFFIILLMINIFFLKNFIIKRGLLNHIILLLLAVLVVISFPYIFHLFNLNDTFFKFYFILWLILSVLTGLITIVSINSSKKTLLFLNLFFLILFGTSAILFFYSYWKDYKNGIVQRYSYSTIQSSDKEAIKWINKNISGTPIILEAYQNDFSESTRVSSFTGLPTLVGWTYHVTIRGHGLEVINARRQAVDTIYKPDTSAITKRDLIKEYNVKYIYFGNLENRIYGKKSIDDLLNQKDIINLESVYQNNEVTILQITS